MLTLNASDIAEALDFPSTIEALREIFRQGCEMPVRHHHTIAVPEAESATLLLMPAWLRGRYVGVKAANVFPGNASIGRPAVNAAYLLFCGRTGELLALLDGGELTARRTAAASALASRFLARDDATHLLIVGTGRLARHLALAHSAARPIRRVTVWGRNPSKAAAVAGDLAAVGLDAKPAGDLSEAVARADIVSCATLSQAPLVRGTWLSPGTHLDLVGGFTPTMREADDEAVRRASVFVDTREGATAEAGDIVELIRQGILSPSEIRADLYELARGVHRGRAHRDEITFFKSVGAALEDLAAAALAYERRAGSAFPA